MDYATINPLIDRWRRLDPTVNVWVDEDGFIAENTERSPGAIISRFGYWVVGTTVGGNAITLSSKDSAVRFCDHTGWYEDNLCFASKRDYVERPYNDENVRLAQIVLADNIEQLESILVAHQFDALIDQYD